MDFKYAFYLPILCTIWFYSTFIITYIISVCKKDVTPVFPYISDTGTWSPESCIFALMLNIGAIIQGMIVYVRYRQVTHFINKNPLLFDLVTKRNYISIYFGFLAAFGVCLVGNFQETNILVVHAIGAFLAFGLGSIYLLLQTYVSFKLYPDFGNKTTNYVRLFCSVTATIMFVLSSGFGVAAIQKFQGDDITKWTKNDGGYVSHFVSVIYEWIMAIASILFLGLYTQEFKKISFAEPPLIETA